ncbi:hypothetical protein AB4401_12100 [Vibrio cyclitrophicus]|nr:hypothetical protein F0Z19_4827 [Vibrio cyclitrophicus]
MSSFLFGEDHYSGQNFEHHWIWSVERICLLSRVLAVGVCLYHYVESLAFGVAF